MFSSRKVTGIPLIESSAPMPSPAANTISTSSSTGSSNQTLTNQSSTTSASSSSKQTAAAQPLTSLRLNTDFDQTDPVLGKQIELVVNVLKNKLSNQDGLQQAYTLLNNFSRINSSTRSMIIKHLLSGTREKFTRLIKEMNIYLQLKVNNAINLDDSNFKLLSLDLIYSDGNCLVYKIFNI